MTYDPLEGLLERFETPIIEDDPVVWIKKELKKDTWSKQREILRLLEIVPNVAVPSCHSAGKSMSAALAASRFLAKHTPGTARVITTAPTMTQVRAVLWNEINQLHAETVDVLPGRVNQTEWWIGGYMAGLGRKPADYNPAAFSGLHAEHILIIIDEAGGVPNDVWVSVDTLATNIGAKILAIGNPDDPQTRFKDVVHGAPENGWTVVKIPAWETPNFTGEPCAPIFSKVLLTPGWVDRRRDLWGEDSALWASKVAAEFPDESQMTVMRVADITYALNYDEYSTSKLEDVQLGVDIAASATGDETVIRERRGNRVLRRWAIRSDEPDDISDLIYTAAEESGATLIHVDATGVGFGFISDVRRRVRHAAVMPFIAAGRAVDPKQFENRRAEAHWYVREELRHRDLDLSEMEHSEETVAQMTSIRYRLKKGRIIVEPKDDVRARIGRSPDDSDALLLAILPPDGSGAPAPATVRSAARNRNRRMMPRRSRTLNAQP